MNSSDKEQTYFNRYARPAILEFVAARIVPLVCAFLMFGVAAFALYSWRSHAPASEQSNSSATTGLTGRVADSAHIFSDAEKSVLSARLSHLEAETGHQLVIVTVPSLDGEDIAPFATRLFNAMGIGRKGIDDGVMILVAPNERKARIEVGKGLESKLSATLCSDIMQNSMIPQFKAGEFYGGVRSGADQLIRYLD